MEKCRFCKIETAQVHGLCKKCCLCCQDLQESNKSKLLEIIGYLAIMGITIVVGSYIISILIHCGKNI